MDIIVIALTAVLLVAYVAWGIVTLRLRYRYHEDLPVVVEEITLICVILFCVFEAALIKRWIDPDEIGFFFAVLGLIVSAAALYGHMVVSLASQLIVDMVMPGDRSAPSEPQYGPAEALERQGDFEGAIREYMVIARIFPKAPTAAIRVGDNLVKLGRAKEAAPWFERGLAHLDSGDTSLKVTNRLFEIYVRDLERPQQARKVLEDYLERFPDAEYADSVRQRLEQLDEMGKRESQVV